MNNKYGFIIEKLILIGKTVDEAIFELDKYLDDAYIAHLPQVYIIHGKGTGALRSAIQNHLKNSHQYLLKLNNQVFRSLDYLLLFLRHYMEL